MMATKTAPIFASSFLRQSSLHGHGSIMSESSSTVSAETEYHWYSTQNLQCVEFAQHTDDALSKREWLHLLSLISTRFIQVSWRILHDLQIAPPSNTYHLYNHDEWVMLEICYNGIKTVSCIQTIKQPAVTLHSHDETPLIRFSPLIITDLHLPYTVNANQSSLISVHKNAAKIGLRSIDFHNFPVAKLVRFQLVSSLSHSAIHSSSTPIDYNKIVSRYLCENKINDVELMKDDYYVHHKCVWNGQIVAIPIIEHNDQIQAANDANSNRQSHKKPTSLRGRAALKHFYAHKHVCTTKDVDVRNSNAGNNDMDATSTTANKYRVKYWLYIQITDITLDEKKSEHALQNIEYYRILPAVTNFEQIQHDANAQRPRLCEYYSSILLHDDERINGDNLFHHYRIPRFYEQILQNILFPNLCYKHRKDSRLSVALKNVNVNPSFLMIASRGHRLSNHLRNMAKTLGLNYVYKNCIEVLGPNMSATVQHMKNFLHSALNYWPLILHLDCLHLFEFEANIHSFYNTSGKIKPILPIVHVLQEFMSRNNQKKVILFCSANNITKITRELRAIFTYEHIIESIFDQDHKCETEIVPTSLETHISELNLINGLNTTQLFEIAHSQSKQSKKQGDKSESVEDIENRAKVFQEAIDNIRYRQSLYNINLNINVSSIPSVKWADVGGLESAKQEILNIIKLPLQYASIFASIKQSSGILLYGPPGTGKTLLAKAIATEFKMNFISIKGPELLNPYVGQSEENIRNVFSKAIQSRPCILFFDEIDALVPSRGKSSDGGNVMDRVVSQLLTEVDSVSMQYNGEIFIIAATNRPDLLDASLLRPKRLDKQIYLGIPEKETDKLKIIKALTRKFEFDEKDEMTKNEILKKVSQNSAIEAFTGADLYALCCDAMMVSLKLLIEEIQSLSSDHNDLSVDLLMELIQNQKREELQTKHGIRLSDAQWQRIKDFKVKLELQHFQDALVNIKPSLTQQEILQYQSIHRKTK